MHLQCKKIQWNVKFAVQPSKVIYASNMLIQALSVKCSLQTATCFLSVYLASVQHVACSESGESYMKTDMVWNPSIIQLPKWGNFLSSGVQHQFNCRKIIVKISTKSRAQTLVFLSFQHLCIIRCMKFNCDLSGFLRRLLFPPFRISHN